MKFSIDIRAKIMAYTFCGEAPFDLLYRDGNVLNISRKNIYYVTPDDLRNYPERYNFKKIPNFSRYYISNSGVVYSNIRNSILHHKISPLGYHSISIYDDSGKRYTIPVHRLVYYTWNEVDIDNQNHINHYDGRPWNNCLGNLEETTPLENTRHAINIIKTRDYSWTENDIRTICELLADGTRPNDIYGYLIQNGYETNLNCVKSLCHHLASGTKFWQDISSEYNFSKYFSGGFKYSNETIHRVCELLSKGYRPGEITEEVNVPLKYIWEIREGLVRKPISSQYSFPQYKS